MSEILYGKKLFVFNPLTEKCEKAEVICHYGKYSETCHRVFGGDKEIWNYPNLIDVKFESGTISHGHFVPHFMTIIE